jgi:NodT family efflux transporter outer membrane factor (OMF) lipoprotein
LRRFWQLNAPAGLALLLGAWLASGCATGPHYVRPADPVQSGYLKPPNSRAGTDSTPGNEPTTAPHTTLGGSLPAQWWTLLRSPEIDRLVNQALQNNQSVAAAKAHLAAARERVRAARGAWYPQVQGAAAAQRTRFGAPVLGSLAKDFPPFSAYSAGAEVSYDLDVFGGTRSRVEQAAAAAQYQSTQLAAVALVVSGNVAIQALQIATVRAQIRVADQIVSDDEHMLSLIRAARELGAVSEIDVLSAQSQLDHDRTLLPPLRQQVSEAQDTLADLIGAVPADAPPLQMDLESLTPPDDLPLALPSELVRRRPDIGAAEAQLHAAAAAVGVATAAMYPRFTLSASLAQEGLLSGGPSEIAWHLIGGLTAPLFRGGTLSAERRAAQADYQAALATYRQTVLNAFSQVAASLQALSNDSEFLISQQRALESASASLTLTREAYVAGDAGYVRVLDAERLNSQAQLGRVQADGQRYIDTVKLLLAAGGRVN